jgi:hypothetical protein
MMNHELTRIAQICRLYYIFGMVLLFGSFGNNIFGCCQMNCPPCEAPNITCTTCIPTGGTFCGHWCCSSPRSCDNGTCCPPEQPKGNGWVLTQDGWLPICCPSEEPQYCSGGGCCYKPLGCSSWKQKKCADGDCKPCLHKAATYAELQACSNKVPDPSYTPTSNGCGPDGGPQIPNNPTGCGDTSFLEPCNAHDICYGTCGSNKDSCDHAFLDAMLEICSGSSCAYSCSQYANTYYGAVHNYGETAYESAQLAACACCDCS